MRKAFVAGLLCLVLAGCAPTIRLSWICVADVFQDSQCLVIDCDKAEEICRGPGYRILKNYVSGVAYIYSVDPLTDLKRCKESAGVK